MISLCSANSRGFIAFHKIMEFARGSETRCANGGIAE
jgi:hypothetical protein